MGNHLSREIRRLHKAAKMLLAAGYDYWYENEKPQGEGWKKNDTGKGRYTYRRKQTEEERRTETDGTVPKTRSGASGRNHSYESTAEFRDVQRASLSVSAEDTALFHSGGKQLDEGVRERLSGVLRRQLLASYSERRDDYTPLVNPSTGQQRKFYNNVPSDLFHDCFEICQKYLQNGDCVTVHEKEEYRDNQNYLSEDGLSGISITPDGDLISVFNIGERGFLKTIAPLVKEKCKTLDCYDSDAQHLPKYYEKAFGFKTASILAFNADYVDRHFIEVYGEAPVHFMLNPKFAKTDHVEAKEFGKDDYDDALAYRNSLVKEK